MQGQPGHPSSTLPPGADLQELLREINELKAGLLVDGVTHDNPTFEGPPWVHERVMQGSGRLHIDIQDDDSLEDMVAKDARLRYILSPQADEQVLRSSLRFEQDSPSPQRPVPGPYVPESLRTSAMSPGGFSAASGTPITPVDSGTTQQPGYDPYMARDTTYMSPGSARRTPMGTPGIEFMPPASSAEAVTPSLMQAAAQSRAAAAATPQASGAARNPGGSRIARPAGSVTPGAALTTGRTGSSVYTGAALSSSTPVPFARASASHSPQATPAAHQHATPGVATRGGPTASTPLQPPRGTVRDKAAASIGNTGTHSTASRTPLGSSAAASRAPAPRHPASSGPSPRNSVGPLRSVSGSVSSSVANTPAAGSVRKRPSQSGPDGAPARRVATTSSATGGPVASPSAAHGHSHGPTTPRLPRTPVGAAPGSSSKVPGKSGHSYTGPSQSRGASPAGSVPSSAAATPVTAAHAAEELPTAASAPATRSTAAAAASSPLDDSREMECEASDRSLTLPSWGGADPLAAESLEAMLEADPALNMSWMAATERTGAEVLPGGSPAAAGEDSRVLQRRTSDELLKPLAAAMAVGQGQEDWMQEDADEEMNLLMAGGDAEAGGSPSAAVAAAEDVAGGAGLGPVGATPYASRPPVSGVSPAPVHMHGLTPQKSAEVTPARPPTVCPPAAAAIGSTMASPLAAQASHELPGSTVCKVRELLGLDDPDGPHAEDEAEAGGRRLNSEELWRNIRVEANSIAMAATVRDDERCQQRWLGSPRDGCTVTPVASLRMSASAAAAIALAYEASSTTVCIPVLAMSPSRDLPNLVATPAPLQAPANAAAPVPEQVPEVAVAPQSSLPPTQSRAVPLQLCLPTDDEVVVDSGDLEDSEAGLSPAIVPLDERERAETPVVLTVRTEGDGDADSGAGTDTDMDGSALELLAAEAAAAAEAVVAGGTPRSGVHKDRRGLEEAQEAEPMEEVEAGTVNSRRLLLQQSGNNSSFGYTAAVAFEAAMISRQLAGGGSASPLGVTTYVPEDAILEEEGAEMESAAEGELPPEVAGEALMLASRLQGEGGGGAITVGAFRPVAASELGGGIAEEQDSEGGDESSSSSGMLAAAAAEAAAVVMSPVAAVGSLVSRTPAEATTAGPDIRPEELSAVPATAAPAPAGVASGATEPETVVAHVATARPSPDVVPVETGDQSTATSDISVPLPAASTAASGELLSETESAAAAVGATGAVAVVAASRALPKDSSPDVPMEEVGADGAAAGDQSELPVMPAERAAEPPAMEDDASMPAPGTEVMAEGMLVDGGGADADGLAVQEVTSREPVPAAPATAHGAEAVTVAPVEAEVECGQGGGYPVESCSAGAEEPAGAPALEAEEDVKAAEEPAAASSAVGSDESMDASEEGEGLGDEDEDAMDAEAAASTSSAAGVSAAAPEDVEEVERERLADSDMAVDGGAAGLTSDAAETGQPAAGSVVPHQELPLAGDQTVMVDSSSSTAAHMLEDAAVLADSADVGADAGAVTVTDGALDLLAEGFVQEAGTGMALDGEGEAGSQASSGPLPDVSQSGDAPDDEAVGMEEGSDGQPDAQLAEPVLAGATAEAAGVAAAGDDGATEASDAMDGSSLAQAAMLLGDDAGVHETDDGMSGVAASPLVTAAEMEVAQATDPGPAIDAAQDVSAAAIVSVPPIIVGPAAASAFAEDASAAAPVAVADDVDIMDDSVALAASTTAEHATVQPPSRTASVFLDAAAAAAVAAALRDSMECPASEGPQLTADRPEGDEGVQAATVAMAVDDGPAAADDGAPLTTAVEEFEVVVTPAAEGSRVVAAADTAEQLHTAAADACVAEGEEVQEEKEDTAVVVAAAGDAPVAVAEQSGGASVEEPQVVADPPAAGLVLSESPETAAAVGSATSDAASIPEGGSTGDAAGVLPPATGSATSSTTATVPPAGLLEASEDAAPSDTTAATSEFGTAADVVVAGPPEPSRASDAADGQMHDVDEDGFEVGLSGSEAVSADGASATASGAPVAAAVVQEPSAPMVAEDAAAAADHVAASEDAFPAEAAPESERPAPEAAAEDARMSDAGQVVADTVLDAPVAADTTMIAAHQDPSPSASSGCGGDDGDDGVPEELPHKVPAGAGPALQAAAATAAAAAAGAAQSNPALHPVKYARYESPRSLEPECAAAAGAAQDGASASGPQNAVDAEGADVDTGGEDAKGSSARKRVRLPLVGGPVAEGAEVGGESAGGNAEEEAASDAVTAQGEGAPEAGIAAAAATAVALTAQTSGLVREDRLASDASQASSAFASVQAMAAVARDVGQGLSAEHDSIGSGMHRITPESLPSDTFSLVFSEMDSRMFSNVTTNSWATPPNVSRQPILAGSGTGPDAASFSDVSAATGRTADALAAATVIAAGVRAAAAAEPSRASGSAIAQEGAGHVGEDSAVEAEQGTAGVALVAASKAALETGGEDSPRQEEDEAAGGDASVAGSVPSGVQPQQHDAAETSSADAGAPEADGPQSPPSPAPGLEDQSQQPHSPPPPPVFVPEPAADPPVSPSPSPAAQPADGVAEQPLLHAWQVLASPASPSGSDGSTSPGGPPTKAARVSSRTSLRSMLGSSSRLSRVTVRQDDNEGEEGPQAGAEAHQETASAAVVTSLTGASVAGAAALDAPSAAARSETGGTEAAGDAEANAPGGAVAGAGAEAFRKDRGDEPMPDAAAEEGRPDASLFTAPATPTTAAAGTALEASRCSSGSINDARASTMPETDEQLVPAWKLVQPCSAGGGAAGASSSTSTAGSPSAMAATSLGCRRSLRSIQLSPSGSPLKRQASRSSPGLSTNTTETGAAGMDASSPETSPRPASARAVTGAAAAAMSDTVRFDSEEEGEDLRPAWKAMSGSGQLPDSPEAVAAARGAPLGSMPSFGRSGRSGHSRLHRSSAPDGEVFNFADAGTPWTAASADDAVDVAQRPPSGGGAEGAWEEAADEDSRTPPLRTRSRTQPGHMPGGDEPASPPARGLPVDVLQLQAHGSYSSDGSTPSPVVRGSRTRPMGFNRSVTLDDRHSGSRLGTYSESGGVAAMLASRLSCRRIIPDSIGSMPLPRRSAGGGDPNVDAMRPAWQVLPLAMASPGLGITPTTSVTGAGGGTALAAGGSTSGAPSVANMLASMRSSSRLSRMSSGIPEELLAELKVQAQAAVGHLQGPHHSDDTGGGLADLLSSVEEGGSQHDRSPPNGDAPAPEATVGGDGAGGTVHAWKVLPVRVPPPSTNGMAAAVVGGGGHHPGFAQNPGLSPSRMMSLSSGRPALGATRAGNMSSRLAVASNKAPPLQVSFDAASPAMHTLEPTVPEDDELQQAEDDEDEAAGSTTPSAPSVRPEEPPQEGPLVPAWKLVGQPPAGPEVLPPAHDSTGGSPSPGASRPPPHALGTRRSLKSLGSVGGSRLSRTSTVLEDYVDDTYSTAQEPDSGDGSAAPSADHFVTANSANQDAVAAAVAAAAAAGPQAAESAASRRSSPPHIEELSNQLQVEGTSPTTDQRAAASGGLLPAGGSSRESEVEAQQPDVGGSAEMAATTPSAGDNSSPTAGDRDWRQGLQVQVASSLGGEEVSSPFVPVWRSAQGSASSGTGDSSSGVSSDCPAAEATASKLSTPPGSGRRPARGTTAGSSRLSRMTSQASQVSESGLEDIVEEATDGGVLEPTAEDVTSAECSGSMHALYERASFGRAPPPAPSAGKARIGSPAGVLPSSPLAPSTTASPVASASAAAAAAAQEEEEAALVPAWKVLAPAQTPVVDARADVDFGERTSPLGSTRQPALRTQRSGSLSHGSSRLSRMTSGVGAEEDVPSGGKMAAAGTEGTAPEITSGSHDDGDTPALVADLAVGVGVAALATVASDGAASALQSAGGQAADSVMSTQELSVLTLANLPSGHLDRGSAVSAAGGAAAAGSGHISSSSVPTGLASGAASPPLVARLGGAIEEEEGAQASTGAAKTQPPSPSATEAPAVARSAGGAADGNPARVEAREDAAAGDGAVSPQRAARRSRGMFACFTCFGGAGGADDL